MTLRPYSPKAACEAGWHLPQAAGQHLPLAARVGDLDVGALEAVAGFRASAYGLYPRVVHPDREVLYAGGAGKL